ncbi:DUF5677 domain-containing protein [uncultured Tolumonas sp.]|uniref:DUF5677 domain-containing protein n=1 Tax=uncultured Tolumonas sp. TaxID=263765 RepID=UPI002A0A5149|nr:DUF5677 domain-containing protein [uncultured Tolumonas sp.]
MTLKHKKPNLDANPFSLITSRKVVKIDPKNIIGRDDIELDPQFQKKYTEYLLKNKSCFITRLTISRIMPGFLKRENGKLIHVEDSILDGQIEYVIDLIKSGERPPLHIYKLYTKEFDYEYCSPDDIHVYYAYKQLGIKKVPVIIYGDPGELEESTFKNKGLFKDKEDHYYSHSNININRNYFPSITHDSKKSTIPDISKCLDNCIELVSNTKHEYKLFHAFKIEIHYHHIIHAILLRLYEDLKAIKMLIDNNLLIQSAGLLRSIYELMLNFYLVWISPREMSEMLKFKSLLSINELLKIVKNNNSDLNTTQLRELEKIYTYQYNLVSKVIEKAKFSPFGESYYESIYRFLSDITHHDFSSTARYRHALEHGDKSVYSSDLLTTIVNIADFITSFVCLYALDDIGVSSRNEI